MTGDDDDRHGTDPAGAGSVPIPPRRVDPPVPVQGGRPPGPELSLDDWNAGEIRRGTGRADAESAWAPLPPPRAVDGIESPETSPPPGPDLVEDGWDGTADGWGGGDPAVGPLSEYRQGWLRRLVTWLRGPRARSYNNKRR